MRSPSPISSIRQSFRRGGGNVPGVHRLSGAKPVINDGGCTRAVAAEVVPVPCLTPLSSLTAHIIVAES